MTPETIIEMTIEGQHYRMQAQDAIGFLSRFCRGAYHFSQPLQPTWVIPAQMPETPPHKRNEIICSDKAEE